MWDDWVPCSEGPRPPPCKEAAVTQSSSHLWVFGGILTQNGAERRLLAGLWCFDLETATWEYQVPWTGGAQQFQAPPARYSALLCHHGSSLWLVGGRHACGEVYRDLWRFDIEGRFWNPVPGPHPVLLSPCAHSVLPNAGEWWAIDQDGALWVLALSAIKKCKTANVHQVCYELGTPWRCVLAAGSAPPATACAAWASTRSSADQAAESVSQFRPPARGKTAQNAEKANGNTHMEVMIVWGGNGILHVLYPESQRCAIAQWTVEQVGEVADHYPVVIIAAPNLFNNVVFLYSDTDGTTTGLLSLSGNAVRKVTATTPGHGSYLVAANWGVALLGSEAGWQVAAPGKVLPPKNQRVAAPSEHMIRRFLRSEDSKKDIAAADRWIAQAALGPAHAVPELLKSLPKGILKRGLGECYVGTCDGKGFFSVCADIPGLDCCAGVTIVAKTGELREGGIFFKMRAREQLGFHAEHSNPDMQHIERVEGTNRKQAAGGSKQRAKANDPCPCGSGRKFKKCCGHPTGSFEEGQNKSTPRVVAQVPPEAMAGLARNSMHEGLCSRRFLSPLKNKGIGVFAPWVALELLTGTECTGSSPRFLFNPSVISDEPWCEELCKETLMTKRSYKSWVKALKSRGDLNSWSWMEDELVAAGLDLARVTEFNELCNEIVSTILGSRSLLEQTLSLFFHTAAVYDCAGGSTSAADLLVEAQIACTRPTVRSTQADSMLMHAMAARAADHLHDTSRLPLLPPGVGSANEGRQGRDSCGNPACAMQCPVNQKFQKCSACKGVYYCSEACQREHYVAHRMLCKQVVKACAAEAVVVGLPVPVGTPVEVAGLRNAIDLNGQVGKVVGCQDGRLQVEFGSSSKALRCCNVLPVAPSSKLKFSVWREEDLSAAAGWPCVRVAIPLKQAGLMEFVAAAGATVQHLELKPYSLNAESSFDNPIDLAAPGLCFKVLRELRIEGQALSTVCLTSVQVPRLESLEWCNDPSMNERIRRLQRGGDPSDLVLPEQFDLDLPSLKTLDVEYVEVADCTALGVSISRSPELMHLHFYKFWGLTTQAHQDAHFLNIPSCKTIDLHRCDDLDRIIFWAPSAEQLTLRACYNLASALFSNTPSAAFTTQASKQLPVDHAPLKRVCASCTPPEAIAELVSHRRVRRVEASWQLSRPPPEIPVPCSEKNHKEVKAHMHRILEHARMAPAQHVEFLAHRRWQKKPVHRRPPSGYCGVLLEDPSQANCGNEVFWIDDPEWPAGKRKLGGRVILDHTKLIQEASEGERP